MNARFDRRAASVARRDALAKAADAVALVSLCFLILAALAVGGWLGGAI